MELFMEPGADPMAVAGGNYIVNEQFVEAYAPETVFQPGFFITT